MMGAIPCERRSERADRALSALTTPFLVAPAASMASYRNAGTGFVLFLRDAQQLGARRGAVGNPAIAVLAHAFHAVAHGRGPNVCFRHLIVDLGADGVRD